MYVCTITKEENDEMRLNGKVVIVTGGAKGIGKEISLRFAREGARVVIICDVDTNAAEQALLEIQEISTDSTFYQMDVTNRQQVFEVIHKIKEKFGRIDVMINNAGINCDSFLKKMTEEQWDKVIAVNLKGVFNCAQAVVELMIQQGKGKIINTTSIVGLYGNIGQTNYAASKFGIIGMTKTWAKELGPKGINVNAVAPGFIMTQMTEKMPQHILDEMQLKTPLRRLGTPADVANAFLYLASDEADYVNGTVLSVDGGLVL